jgi:hypothetical protein
MGLHLLHLAALQVSAVFTFPVNDAGPGDVLLGCLSLAPMLGPLRNPLVTFGRVPLFFYFGQWYTAHLLAILIGVIAGQPVAWQWESPIDKFTKPPLPGIGFPLWVVYLCWIGGVLFLYPLCKWFAGVKAR